jgi:hypothetical protein
MDVDVHRRACLLLRETRSLTFRWISDISTKSDHLQDENSRSSLQDQICMLAVTCFSTFDVCSEHIPSVLDSEEDFSVALQCAVIVRENMPPSLSANTSPYLIRMLSRHRRLLHSLELIFGQSSQFFLGRTRLLHAGAYNNALERLGLGYRQCSSSNWHALPRPNSRWISCVTDGGWNVHYDVLTGELLIGGKRFGRLPQEILKHPTYASIFGTVSGQSRLLYIHTYSDLFSENIPCGSCRQPRHGLYDSIYCVRVPGKALHLFYIRRCSILVKDSIFVK